ncbi:hypothetical protein MLD38_040531 [Melastoma candidum]|nr:hypothetical protein MLD38_040531 [Melastoma candidum]
MGSAWGTSPSPKVEVSLHIDRRLIHFRWDSDLNSKGISAGLLAYRALTIWKKTGLAFDFEMAVPLYTKAFCSATPLNCIHLCFSLRGEGQADFFCLLFEDPLKSKGVERGSAQLPMQLLSGRQHKRKNEKVGDG